MIDPTIISEALNKRGELQDVVRMISRNDHAEAVMFILDLLENIGILNMVKNEPKCKNKSTLFRNLGNDAFIAPDLSSALLCYNNAIVHAPTGSKAMMMAYGNRSAVLYEIKKYRACLKDIETAIGLGYPKSLLPKLLKRQDACIKELNEEPKVSSKVVSTCKRITTLTGPNNDQISCASASVKVVLKNSKRAIVATEPIKVGDVVAVEIPYASHLNEDTNFLCCYFCFKFFENLIPCDKCCYALFCSTACKEKCWKEHHQYECQIMSISYKFPNTFRLALKTVIKARIQCSSWDKLMEQVEKATAVDTELRGFVKVTDTKYELTSENYESICTQSKLESLPKFGRAFNLSVMSAIAINALTGVLINEPNKKKENQIKRFVAKQLVFHSMDSLNIHMSSAYGALGSNVPQQHYMSNKATGFFAFAGLIKHSCNENVDMFALNNKLVILAMKSIQPGEEIVTSYGSSFLDEGIKHRKYILYKFFGFLCKCEACIHNWVTEKEACPVSPIEDQTLIDSISSNIFHIKSLEDAAKKFELLMKGMEVFQNKPTSIHNSFYYNTAKHCIKWFQLHLAPQYINDGLLSKFLKIKNSM